jgi:hypothetical protein
MMMLLTEDSMLGRKEAASYLNLPTATLANQLRSGGGPAHVRISKNTVLFRKCDLDAWRATWQIVTPASKAPNI